ncbi:HSP20-like chaperone [Chiua virens]|nr:HSP20-like chaperone [Chiua virens]
MSATTHPEVLWAQRSSTSDPAKNIIYLTVNLPDIVESSLKYALEPKSISFKAHCNNVATDYAFDLEFFAEIDPDKSSVRLTSRSLLLVLHKKEMQSEFWPRLTKEKIKTPFIKTDFNKWVDEDEQDGNPNIDEDLVGGIPGMDDMSMGGMGGMGGYGRYGWYGRHGRHGWYGWHGWHGWHGLLQNDGAGC